MSDITKIREWDDGEDNGDWPPPPHLIESRVTGDLRARILTRVGRAADDTVDVRLIELAGEDGYSEWTVEFYFSVEVWLHDEGQAQRVWSHDEDYSSERALAAFIDWTEGTR